MRALVAPSSLSPSSPPRPPVSSSPLGSTRVMKKCSPLAGASDGVGPHAFLISSLVPPIHGWARFETSAFAL